MLRQVKTENGLVKGLPAADPRITSFKGIPFAAPPVGENRWRAPQPCKDWDGVLEAYEFAPISIQDTPGIGDNIYNREWHVDSSIPMSEDCLYLNVWTPAKSADEKLPVLVWFFGGGLQWGYPSEMEFDGERIARRGVIVVTVNYRLGAMGFLSHPELSASQPDAPTNFGSLDQQAGLDWTIRNIAAFGGDPKKITISGQSAGGGSVLTQMTCEQNYGKISGAVIMSAMIRNPYVADPFLIPKPLKEAEKNGSDFFECLGVSTLEEARALDALYIRDKYAEFAANHPRFATTQDGVFCVGDPLVRFIKNERAQVPVIAGHTGDEYTCFINAEDAEELKCKAEEYFGDKAEEYLSFKEVTESELNQKGKYGAVKGIECTIKLAFLNNMELNNDSKCYYYRFEPIIPGWDNPGTFHSVDLWFFFETLAKCWRPFDGRHYDLARQMCDYWCNFIKTGNPNGKDLNENDLPLWENFTKEHQCEMKFGMEGAKPEYPGLTPFKEFIMDNVKSGL